MAPIGRLIRPTKHLRIHGFDAPFPESSFTSNDMEQSITQERPGGPNALTDQSYWSNYYGRHRQPSPNSESIIAAGSRLDNCWDETIKAAGTPKTIWEIGCYPGRYVAARHGMRALGLDFNDDTETVERNLAAMGVTDFKAIQADFFSYIPEEKADVVISLGFVEHFQDLDDVLDRHLNYLSDSGALFVIVPNMRGLIYPYKLLVDRANMNIHNLEAMKLSVYRRFAERNNLKIKFLRYKGGFPACVHQSLNLCQKLIHWPVIALARRARPLLERYPRALYSSEIVALFTR
jgi:2-polyprenyl-3-methyl-5-hydroxy-6-metoxy-1,4-benzoquinol methylase